MNIVKEMKEEFTKLFGARETKSFFSPGRVNLIGEHTDYNGGHVFPCAISLGTYAVVASRADRKVCMYSMNFPEQGVVECALDALSYDKETYGWGNYPMGVMQVFQSRGIVLSHGFDLVVYGNLPNGAGLSSSASIEVLTAVLLNDAFGCALDMVTLVKMCQQAENEFVGVNCGIMDQFSIGMGKKNCAILLDCNMLAYRYSKINLEGCQIVIANTNKKRGLGDSNYNERRAECEQALAELQAVVDIQSLGALDEVSFEKYQHAIADPVRVKRARHAVLENRRALKAVEALESNDLALFGKLMNESHISLRDDYEVTGLELDTLVELAWRQEGVIGARMTGAGFGGCTVSIVENACINAFQENITAAYQEKIGYKPSFYVADIADGAAELKE